MDNEVKHDEAKCLFYMEADGLTAYAEYRLTDDGGLDILHTVVPKPLEGKGIAALLVKTAYDYALRNGLHPVATCAYAEIWLKRHPEVAGL